MKYFKLGMDRSKEKEVICHYDHDYGIQQNEFIIGKKCLVMSDYLWEGNKNAFGSYV